MSTSRARYKSISLNTKNWDKKQIRRRICAYNTILPGTSRLAESTPGKSRPLNPSLDKTPPIDAPPEQENSSYWSPLNTHSVKKEDLPCTEYLWINCTRASRDCFRGTLPVPYQRRGFPVPNIHSVPETPVFYTECLSLKKVDSQQRVNNGVFTHPETVQLLW